MSHSEVACDVLIVEDDEDCRSAIGEVLQERLAVAEASDGAEALNLLRNCRTPPALILLDLCMPVMDGDQFMVEMRTDSRLAAIPVVLVSGEPDLPERALALGAVGYLSKPYEVEELLEVVERHCRRGTDE